MDSDDGGVTSEPGSGPTSPRSKTVYEVNQGQRPHAELVVETYSTGGSGTLSYSGVVEGQDSADRETTIDDVMTRSLSPHESMSPRDTASPRDSTSPRDSASPRDVHHSRQGSSDMRESPEPTGPGPRQKSTTTRMSPTLPYFSGNPSVEVTKGILHLYKDDNMVPLNEDIPRSEMVCILSVPAAHTIHDLIQFIAPVNFGIEYMRVIRDSKPNNYMVLIKFQNQKLADEFYNNYNTVPFNSIENYICHLVYVARVETMKATEGASLPIPGLTELPNCPVCLERMDESVDGILTILCNHSFHISCLTQWPDTTCPVCRYIQTPEQTAESKCHECGSQESLWICLICGHVGCGRYTQMHAYSHFQMTHHCYSMHLGNKHVWDYAGDNYVHRLVQNKADGKLVEVDEGGNVMRQEKLDSLNLEYTFLLTSQLESQRMYFEEKMNKILEDSKKEVEGLKLQYEDQTHGDVDQRVKELTRDKNVAEKKCHQLHERLTKVFSELQDEQALNKSLLNNQREWQEQVVTLQTQIRDVTQSKETEVGELRDELRDIMFHIGAQEQLSNTDAVTQQEVQEGQVVVGAAAPGPSTRKTRKKGR